MLWIRFLTIWSLTCLLTLSATGCGTGVDLGPLVSVEGVVLLKDRPLAERNCDFAKVWFYPDPRRGNTCAHVPMGVIDNVGHYRLTTAGRSGAPKGWYRVMVIAVARSSASPGKKRIPRQSLIHRKFESVETSGLIVEVVDNPSTGAYDLKVAPPR